MQVASEALVYDLRQQLAGLPAVELLATIAAQFPDQAVFSTSFGLEDQIITHLIFEHNLPIKVFTLDTARNFQETYSTWNKTLLRYGKAIEPYFPVQASVEELLLTKGPNSFYDSVDNRKECCGIRKVEPLNRALKGQQAWFTGIRAEQSANRQDMHAVEWDAGHQLIKFHPLFDWTFEQCWAFVHEHSIPFNPLHQQGFVSIGCAPCTRAIKAGEDFRAGRWWWEDQSAKECGLHSTHNGPDPVVEPVNASTL
ncbi:phosphoadenylyl-sulfate reductase [Hymenobacter lucidus]|uniref:Adenosine 5'-phosphosulfate reductase n=1 Tax=Hymenobacter lucidus TaxID=2880930 RepID=A0ABS8AVE5_9BACT|nr:phosphoadenylyl-sulfate reductase [Hymenobacter lucidus]MCB2409593.1 phosphoadenylyl-sulfate reductase [Hymenobacter lucidus]